MDHDARTGQRETFALAPRGEDEGCHGGGEAEVDGDDLAFDELHGVEDGEAGDDGSSGAVDVEVDGFGGVFFVEVEEDADDLIGEFVVDFGSEEDDAFSVETIVDVYPVGLKVGGILSSKNRQ